MILKIKKRDLNIMVLVSVILLAIPLIYAADSIGVISKTFKVTLDIGNEVPTISWLQTGLEADPTDAGTTQVSFEFNVTDSDGVTDINKSTATINITLQAPGGQSRANTSCTNISESGNTIRFNCTVFFYYYNNASASWIINASVMDNSDSTARNASETFTYYELSAMSLQRASINFSQLSLGSNNQAATDNPLMLNNTGNDDFDIINITAYDLVGMTETDKTFGIGNITINSSNTAGAGTALANAAEIYLGSDVKLWHGEGAAGNLTLYFWADVPSDTTKQIYNTTTAWQVEVDDSSD